MRGGSNRWGKHHLEGSEKLGGAPTALLTNPYYITWKGPKSSVVAAAKASSLPRIVSIGLRVGSHDASRTGVGLTVAPRALTVAPRPLVLQI